MEIWVQDSADVVQGDGPITTAVDWRYTAGLDRAGSFSFRMPAADPRAALLAPKLRVRAVTWSDTRFYESSVLSCTRFYESSVLSCGREAGQRIELGYGIVNHVELALEPGRPDYLLVSGTDRLGELAGVQVGDLALVSEATRTPTYLWRTPSSGAAEQLGLPAANVGLGHLAGAIWWLYVGDSQSFDAIDLVFLEEANQSATRWEVQYFDVSGSAEGSWEDVPIISDGTMAGGYPMGQGGRVLFDPPHNWGQHDGSHYVIRFRPLDAPVTLDLGAVTLMSYVPAGDALARVIALSDVDGDGCAGWTLDATSGYTSTLGVVYLRFNGESVLAALVKLAAALGEHFRLGAGRSLVWLRKDVPESGLQAMTNIAGTPGDTLDDGEVHRMYAAPLLIAGLHELRDAGGLFSRIYPHGGGQGERRVDLRDATRALPAGYAYVTDAAGQRSGVKRTPTEAWAGRADNAREAWPEIVRMNDTPLQRRHAANALCDRALEWLRVHAPASAADVPRFYELDLVRLHGVLSAGDSLRVTTQQYRDGVAWVDIRDVSLRVLSVTVGCGPLGSAAPLTSQTVTGGAQGVWASVRLASVDRWPLSDDGLVAALLERASAAQAQVISRPGSTSSERGTPVSLTVEAGAVTAVTRAAGLTGEFVSGLAPDGVSTVYLSYIGGVLVGRREG